MSEIRGGEYAGQDRPLVEKGMFIFHFSRVCMLAATNRSNGSFLERSDRKSVV